MIFCCTFALKDNAVHAAINSATQLTLNQIHKGKLQNSGDKDFYKVVVPSNGNVSLSVKQQHGAYWYGSILNSKGEVYEDIHTDGSEFAKGYATTQVGLPKGTYYIEIESSYEAYGKPYEIKAGFTASNNYEKEFNNNLTTANSINLNQTYKGSLKDTNDEDFYKVVVPSNGNVSLSIKQRHGAYWYGSILNSKGEVYEDIHTDGSESVEGYAVTQVGLPKGTYYIQIKNSSDAYDKPYEIKVGFTASNNYEKEFNNNLTTANSINLNQTYKGSLKDTNDEDFYKVVVPSDGNVSLSVKQQHGAYWYGSILNSKGEVYEDIHTDGSESVEGYAVTQVGLPKGTYYIQIENSSDAYDKPYEIKVGFTASNNYEKEFNNNLTTANPINLNPTYRGSLKDTNDKDFYKIVVPNAGNVSLSIKQQHDAWWYGHIQNGSGHVYKYLYTSGDTSVSGFAKTQVWLKKGTYYIQIENSSDAYDKRYEFNVSMTQTPLKTSQLKVINNKGKDDIVTVTGLKKGDNVKVYSSSTKGAVLASKLSTGSAISLPVKQVGTKAGTIYVTVTRSGMIESKRVPVSFTGEQSDPLKISQVKVSNNKGKNDIVTVTGLVKGDNVKVYNSSIKGAVLASKLSTTSSVSLSITQLGQKSGTIYVSVTHSGMKESNRVAVTYSAEK